MSKNKDIKFLHDVTGLSYKVCRQKMKDNNWDLWQALGYDEMVKFLSDKIPDLLKYVSDALVKMAEAATDMANSLKKAIAEAYKNDDPLTLKPIDIKP